MTIGLDRLFETMVFLVNWDDLDEGGCPRVLDWSGVSSPYPNLTPYNTANKATLGHVEVVKTVLRLEGKES